jgi:hypothetical protein
MIEHPVSAFHWGVIAPYPRKLLETLSSAAGRCQRLVLAISDRGYAAFCMRTSENTLKRKSNFAERSFHALG